MKIQLRGTATSDQDGMLTRLIWSAAQKFEQKTGRALMLQTLTGTIDGTPGRVVQFSKPIFCQLLSVSCVNSEGDSSEFSSTFFWLDESHRKALLILNKDAEWPDDLRPRASVILEWTAGFAATADVPAEIQSALIDWVCHRFENGETQENPAAFNSVCRQLSVHPKCAVL